MKKWQINNPTARKIRNRGLRGIRYYAATGVYHGWVIEEKGSVMRIFLVGHGVKRLKGSERRYIKDYDNRGDTRLDTMKGIEL